MSPLRSFYFHLFSILPFLLFLFFTGCDGSGNFHAGVRHLPEIAPATDGTYVVARRVAQMEMPGNPRNFEVTGNALYVFMNQQGMATLDIRKTEAPILTDFQAGVWSRLGGAQEHMYYSGLVDGERLLVADRRAKGIDAFDTRDPLHPHLSWALPLPGEGPVNICRVEGGYYVACSGSGLIFLPRDFNAATTPTAVLRDFDNVKQAEFMAPDWLLLADNFDGGLQTLQIDDPRRPRPVRLFNTGNFVDAMTVGKNYAVLANRNQGVMMVDLRDPAQPVIAALFPSRLGDHPTCLARWGEDRVIVGYNLGYFDIFGMENPLKPTWLGRVVAGSYVNCLAVKGDDLFVGLAIPVSTNPARPTYPLVVFHLEDRRATVAQ